MSGAVYRVTTILTYHIQVKINFYFFFLISGATLSKVCGHYKQVKKDKILSQGKPRNCSWAKLENKIEVVG